MERNTILNLSMLSLTCASAFFVCALFNEVILGAFFFALVVALHAQIIWIAGTEDL